MWPLWLFLALFTLFFLGSMFAAGYAQHMGDPQPIRYGVVIAVSVIVPGIITLLVAGVAALF